MRLSRSLVHDRRRRSAALRTRRLHVQEAEVLRKIVDPDDLGDEVARCNQRRAFGCRDYARRFGARDERVEAAARRDFRVEAPFFRSRALGFLTKDELSADALASLLAARDADNPTPKSASGE